MSTRSLVVGGMLLLVLAQPANGQASGMQPDSARAQIRTVLRSFYHNLETQNWEALAAYVLSPKLLERRGAPADGQMVARDRSRSRGSPHASASARACSPGSPPMIDEATIRLDGDWAEVSVPRCSQAVTGMDEFRMLYFEKRWRFIYTDLYQAQPGSGQ